MILLFSHQLVSLDQAREKVQMKTVVGYQQDDHLSCSYCQET